MKRAASHSQSPDFLFLSDQLLITGLYGGSMVRGEKLLMYVKVRKYMRTISQHILLQAVDRSKHPHQNSNIRAKPGYIKINKDRIERKAQ